ncbi:YciI family protein [Paenisporosarcina indica]|uniref:YciI family protein n=1 Tax=Paenisporosarcina indica TaxID=650093 RepID=UPI00094F6589|nr:YciI family protein [Paenisporosarcina indica]
MLFMMIVKASNNSEAGKLPSSELIEAMTKYNEELVKAGVRVAAKGLHPSSNGIRLSYPKPGGKPVMMDGPFTESNELIAGFILIDVKSREEAIEWAMRMPDPQGQGEGQIELRQVFEALELPKNAEMLAK